MNKIYLFITFAISIVNSLPTEKRSSFTSSGVLAVSSPAFFPSFPRRSIEPLDPVPTGPIHSKCNLDKSTYPSPWTQPDVNHPEVKKAIDAIDWNYVPDISPRTADMVYNEHEDNDCWWTRSQCTDPKRDYLPSDVKTCPTSGDFGLTYDDGPLPPTGPDDPWGEPRLYDFLAEHGQTATLFYVGSNLINFPEAAIRAIESGHTLCAHTWAHPHMTEITNHEIVAQLYWNMKAIKEAAGVTTRCWRPPYGDVDDRVRAIAHQMGLSTILWDSDSFDWGLPSIANDFGGKSDMSEINSHFEDWIREREEGVDFENGRIVLEHETSNMTIIVSEHWLPKLQKVFQVQKVHDCAPELPSPYWES